MNVPDPAETFSGRLPSLPPAPPKPLDVLDPRFPIRLREPARIFWDLTAEWADRETVIGETIRATQQHTDREERFVQPLPITAPMAAIDAPVIYEDLTEPELQQAWDTGPGAAIVTAEPGSHRRHDDNDWFFTQEAS